MSALLHDRVLGRLLAPRGWKLMWLYTLLSDRSDRVRRSGFAPASRGTRLYLIRVFKLTPRTMNCVCHDLPFTMQSEMGANTY